MTEKWNTEIRWKLQFCHCENSSQEFDFSKGFRRRCKEVFRKTAVLVISLKVFFVKSYQNH